MKSYKNSTQRRKPKQRDRTNTKTLIFLKLKDLTLLTEGTHHALGNTDPEPPTPKHRVVTLLGGNGGGGGIL